MPTHAIGEDAFQECDTVGHHAALREAQLPGQGRQGPRHHDQEGVPDRQQRAVPGPVLVDIPKDVSRNKCRFDYPQTVSMRSYNPVTRGHAGQIKKALSLILGAERPMIYTGGGIILANAAPELNRFVDLLGFPGHQHADGPGRLPRQRPASSSACSGMHGTYEANMAMQHCDVLIAIGARFDDRVIGSPKHFAQNPHKIIHVDIDPSSISKAGEGRRADRRRRARDAGTTCSACSRSRSPPGQKTNARALQAWWQQIGESGAKRELPEVPTRATTVIKPQAVVEKLWEDHRRRRVHHVGRRPAPDVGRAVLPLRQSRGAGSTRAASGTMGVGLPYAMGVLLANPGRRSPASPAKGSIQMCIQELSTCKAVRPAGEDREPEQRLPRGMVRQWQQIEYGSRYSQSYVDALPDFRRAGRSATGTSASASRKPADVEPALRDAFGKYKDRLVFMDIITDPTENVMADGAGRQGA